MVEGGNPCGSVFVPRPTIKKVDDTSEDVQALAKAIGRTPGAVALKIWNLASFDERRRARGKVGMTHASKMDKMVWAEYSSAGDELVEEATEVFLNCFDFEEPLSDELKEMIGFDLPEGKEREAIVSMRVNQEFFRNTLLVNYDSRCCLTGLSNKALLVASHIKPWIVSDPKTERLAPYNGLLLNALHDKAFDRGLITITKDLKIVVSGVVGHETPEDEYLWRYNGEPITLPKRFAPRAEFIEYHNDMVFKG